MPVLHDNLPRKMLWFTGIYPLLGFWLLWGGSLWGPIMLVVMVAAAVVVFRAVAAAAAPGLAALAAVATVLIWLFLLQDILVGALSSVIPLGIEPIESAKFGGFLLTFIIGVTGIVASLPLGIVLALGRKSDMPIVKMLRPKVDQLGHTLNDRRAQFTPTAFVFAAYPA